ncbi:hypothetical protein [Botrimarina sp.]|uniref:hypothetical protein n=1 Tax=Botrimarina sp. TaxID=2795802 RepID=UPI0032EECD4A
MPPLPPGAGPLVVSYRAVRRAIGAVGLLLPVALGPLGWLLYGVEIQDNLSSYYHTPMRDVFVGSLFAIGIFLWCYEGYDWIENWTANVGCLAALGVALFPLDAGADPLYQGTWVGWVHSLAGGVFFTTLAFYSLYHFPTSRGDRREPAPHERERNLVYVGSGVVILLSTLAMAGYLLLPPGGLKQWLNRYNFLFWMEWVAVWAFAAAWLTKGRAIVADIAVDLLALPTEAIAGKRRSRR